MKYDNQIRHALAAIEQYKGEMPLTHWLRDFFKHNRQMGSRDRKTLSALVYSYFRFGRLSFGSPRERMLAAVATGDAPNEMKEYFSGEHSGIGLPTLHTGIFPWVEKMSEGIDHEKFSASFLSQPDLFIRIRPGHHDSVVGKLNKAGVAFAACGDACLRLANGTPVDTVLKINHEAVVQDLSSQRTGELLRGLDVSEVWDCCAGSGGKSIMAFDILPGIDITVSDSRNSVLQNLRNRFSQAGIKGYHEFVADLIRETSELPARQYDLVISDVPCTGSGTWARTPEQLHFFNEDRIEYYRGLQQKIVARVIPSVKKNGYLLYITCSVFKSENEEIVKFIKEISELQLVESRLIPGYDHKADTLFVALFRVV